VRGIFLFRDIVIFRGHPYLTLELLVVDANAEGLVNVPPYLSLRSVSECNSQGVLNYVFFKVEGE